MRRAAVFLDRDGVLNHDWWNPSTSAYESPLNPADLHLIDGVIGALRELAAAGFRLIIVTNQPSAAKGKCSLAQLVAVQHRLVELLAEGGIMVQESCVSYRHPDAVVPALGPPCFDRKPSPFFLLRALYRDRLDPAHCWMVGDRATDIACGRAAGVRTIQVCNPHGEAPGGDADHSCANLAAAARHILRAIG